MKFFLYLLSYLSLSYSILAQSQIVPASQLMNYRYQDFFDAVSGNLNYPLAIAYRKMEDRFDNGIRKKRYLQIKSRLETYLGNHELAKTDYYQSLNQPTERVHFDSLGNITKRDLIYPKHEYPSPNKYLDHALNESKFFTSLDPTVQVLAFNELHELALFRSTVFRVLDDCKKLGFEYLALESFYFDKQSYIDQANYPTPLMGFYNGETILSDIVRKAQSLNMKLIAYDYQAKEIQGNLKLREQKSHELLVNSTFAIDSNAKVILLAGGGHISKSTGRMITIGKLLN